jgi:signal peptidase I
VFGSSSTAQLRSLHLWGMRTLTPAQPIAARTLLLAASPSDDDSTSLAEGESELPTEGVQEKSLYKRHRIVFDVVGAIIIIAVVAIIISNTLVAVLQVRGTSMEPTIQEGDVIVTSRGGSYSTGDIIAFNFDNKVLLKRVIAFGGDTVSIDAAGNVTVNGQQISQDYALNPDEGYSDIDYPYTVPEGSIFVLGDNRRSSIDSRSSALGTINTDQVIGKVLFCVWPFDRIGGVS